MLIRKKKFYIFRTKPNLMDSNLIDFVEFIGIQNMMVMVKLIVLIYLVGILSMSDMQLNIQITSFRIYKLIQNKIE